MVAASPSHSSLDFKVRRGTELPVGTQLAWRLRALIISGDLAPGVQLPSVRELGASADVNVNTARAVYQDLEAEGYVVTRERRGSFVAEDAPVEAGLLTLAGQIRARAREAGVPPDDLAAALYMTVAEWDRGDSLVQAGDEPADDSPSSTEALQELIREAGDERSARRTLRRQIAKIEAELTAYPQRLPKPLPAGRVRPPAGHLTDLGELEAIRDELLKRLDEARKARLGGRSR